MKIIFFYILAIGLLFFAISQVETAKSINAFKIENKIKINSFYAEMEGQAQKIPLNGQLFYDKALGIRFIINSPIGKALDYGCNNMGLWIWSGGLEPILYFISNENIDKVNLKLGLKPVLFKTIFGASDETSLISFKDGFVSKNGDEIITFDSEKSVKGCYLYKNNEIQASMEVLSFQVVNNVKFAKIIRMTMFTDNCTSVWTLNNVKFNIKLNKSTFNMPEGDFIELTPTKPR